jgi:RNA-directed DNA polymerase
VNQDDRRFFERLAAAILANGITEASVEQACETSIGRLPHFSRRLTARLKQKLPSSTRPPSRLLAHILSKDFPLQRLRHRFDIYQLGPLLDPPRMVPATGRAEAWAVPSLATEGDLADWLGLDTSALMWFSDPRNLERKATAESLRHYRRRWIPKQNGARLLEAPKPRLKTLQRKILAEILAHIPPHEAAHGFRRGRSTVTFAEPHCRQAMVIRLDLRDFFTSISRARVAAIFRTAGYPEPVSTLLAGLCCTVTPPDILTARPSGPLDWPDRKALEIPHLPQGAPTSPALANLCAFRLDSRLAGLARSAGAAYTRYADDLTFSGGPVFARQARRFEITAAAIALEEGFSINHRKTRIMSQALSQRTAGLVVNERVAIPRKTFETLKAILHNCAKHGPASQNREGCADFRAHLAGRLAQIKATDPHRAARLSPLWHKIQWED